MNTGIYSGLLKDSIPLFPANQKYVEGLGHSCIESGRLLRHGPKSRCRCPKP